MTSKEDFFNKVNIGQQIPVLKKKAEIASYHLPEVFSISELVEKNGKEASAKATEIGVDVIHVSEVFGGPYLLEFLSQMMTGWLPDIRGWVEGGEMDVKFINVVKPGEVVTCTGKVVEKKFEHGNRVLCCDIWVEQQNGGKAVEGRAKIKC